MSNFKLGKGFVDRVTTEDDEYPGYTGLISNPPPTEAEVLEITKLWDEHPDEYDGPCMCKTCLSYGND